MTERFEVHESVTRVYLTGNQEPDPRRVAVPVEDVPGIVRAEVERALDVVVNRAAIGPEEQRRHERFADAYVADRFARFGEGEPEEVVVCSVPGCNCRSAPTERRERTFIPHMGGGQYINEFTQADRARLDKLERFVTALAGIYEISNPGDGRVAKVKDAAREYLR